MTLMLLEVLTQSTIAIHPGVASNAVGIGQIRYFAWVIPATAFFLFLSIFWWAVQRRREREAYYRYELSKRLIENPARDHDSVISWMRDQNAIQDQRHRETLRIASLVLLAGGVGSLIAMAFDLDEGAIAGWICLVVGVVIFLYSLLVSSRSSGGKS